MKTQNTTPEIVEYEVTTPYGQTIIRHDYASANEIALHYSIPVVFVYSDGSRFEQI